MDSDPAVPEPRSAKPTTFPWMVAAYALFSLATICILLIAGWGVYVDFEESRKNHLQVEINRLRSHALRTVLRLQDELRKETPPGNLQRIKHTSDWLRDHWARFIPVDPARLYSAVVDNDRVIIVHSDPALEGKQLPQDWARDVVRDVGDDVFATSEPLLTAGAEAYDISLPVVYEQHEVGTYHSGFNLQHFQSVVREDRWASQQRWGLAFLFIILVLALTGMTLFRITRHLAMLEGALAMGRVRSLANLGQLAGSIAHEVRNPLNAIRLNLHLIQRMNERRNESGGAPDERTDGILQETVREIERVDGLLRTLLNYARPDTPQIENLDLSKELPAVAQFFSPVMQREGISLSVTPPPPEAVVAIDRSRFRQIVLNLLKNAVEAVGPDGRIELTLDIVDGAAEMVIRDYGPGIDPRVRERIFEPFFTTKDVGTGLGLTLVKRYVEEVGGFIGLRNSSTPGEVFVVRLPLVGGRVVAQPMPVPSLTSVG